MKELKIRETTEGWEGYVEEWQWLLIKAAMAGDRGIFQFNMRMDEKSGEEGVYRRCIAGSRTYPRSYIVVEEPK